MDSVQTSQPDAEVITSAERARGVEAWLLLAAPDVAKARAEWEEQGVAILWCGTLFTAVRIPGPIVRAAAHTHDAVGVDAFLAQALGGGPVFASGGLNRYYALVSADTAYDWCVPGTDCLPRRTGLGVPAIGLTWYRPGMPYWASPMDAPGELCDENKVAELIGAGWHRLAQAPPTDRGALS